MAKITYIKSNAGRMEHKFKQKQVNVTKSLPLMDI